MTPFQAVWYVLVLVLTLALAAGCSEKTAVPVATATAESLAAQPPATATPIPTAMPTATPSPVPLASVEGRVLDDATGQPVAGAIVSAGETQATTGDDGRFLIEGLTPGQYVIVVEHPDHDPFVSSILGLKAGETRNVDALLTAGGAAAVPRDPMASNQVDPAGAPTAADAERLARLQGLEGTVVSIDETVLDGEYLVNYKVGETLQAAQATLNHPAWELIDQDGAAWYIVQICGNLAVTRPAQVAVPASHVVQPHPVVTVGEEPVQGFACPAETCEVVTTLPAGWYGSVLGCSQECQWIWVQVAGISGGCWIQVGGSVVYGDSTTVPAIPGEMKWTTAEWMGPGGGPNQTLLVDNDQTVWAIWEEHAYPASMEEFYEAVHYSTWNGEGQNGPSDIPGSDNAGEAMATVLQDGSILVTAQTDIHGNSSRAQSIWYRWVDGQWTTVPEMSQPIGDTSSSLAVAADGYGNVHLLGNVVRTWNGSAWSETAKLSGYVMQADAVAKDQAGNLHAVVASQSAIDHYTWDGRTWSSEPVYTPADISQETVSEPAIAVGPDGVVHAVWVGTTPREYKVGNNPPLPRPHWLSYSRRTDSGWTQPVRIFEAIADDGSFGPGVVVLPDGLVVAAIGDIAVGIEGLWDGAFVTWGMGQTWAKPVRVSPDIKTEPGALGLALDNQGLVHLFYYDHSSKGVFHAIGTR